MYTRLGYILVLASSCGPADPTDATGTAGQSSGATSSTTGASSTDEATSPTPTTGAAGGATSTGSTAGETGEASVTVATTDTTDTTGPGTTTGESSTGEPSGVVYTAEYYIGQINRITVFRADFDADNCAVIKFAEAGSDPNASVTLPPPWQVEWTHVTQGTSSCLGGEPGLAWEAPESVMGTADFAPSMPCTIDIDVIATFPQAAPWVPMEIHFLATGVPVEGAC